MAHILVVNQMLRGPPLFGLDEQGIYALNRLWSTLCGLSLRARITSCYWDLLWTFEEAVLRDRKCWTCWIFPVYSYFFKRLSTFRHLFKRIKNYFLKNLKEWFSWIRQRIKGIWPHWIKAVKELGSRRNLHGRRRKKVQEVPNIYLTRNLYYVQESSFLGRNISWGKT